ncbi:hypothetical protein N657DRAFT_584649 [Parathielavia appendiculata]|uniref:MARVEL domain-containing protein n=1 Tax=Parathielavia appendiculata TaxID=2587402 RepID=A0AAN6Z7P1_9PEZI|nr:hypothetical protein N657DRAFT_584649 [Parathielavia appendiculata]
MADAVPEQQQYAAPAAVAHGKEPEERYIQQTPVWVVVMRGFQILISFIILVMAAWCMHGIVLGANAFALVCWLFTWIIVAYELISEKVPSAQKAYNIWAVLSLDFLMALFWLASMGANAALRAEFNTTVNINSCHSNGKVVNSKTCTYTPAKAKRNGAVADQTGLAVISAIAGLSALVWLLFVATLVFHGHTYRLWHQEHKKPSADNATVEMKAQGTPMLAPQPDAQPVHPQYSDQQQYQSQVYPPQAQQHDAYPQQTAAYAQPPQTDPYVQQAAAYPPQQQYEQQQPYSPHGTPAPGQPYYPPQEQQQQQPYSPHGTPAPGQPYYPPQEKQQ